MEKLRVFESFAGVGSQRMALRNIGCNFEVVGISEVDKNAILAYDAIHENQDEEVEIKSKEDMLFEMREANIAYNFSTGKDEMPRSENDIRKLYVAHKRSKNYGDITKINTDTLPDFDFFTYSFPCKNISIAGKQAGLEKDSGTQSSLVWECERIIRAKKPKYLMMENVKNICGKTHIETFQEWIDLLNNLGYKSYWKVLNGKDYGVPQNRERVIMFSVLDGEHFNFSTGRDYFLTISDILIDKYEDRYIVKKEFELTDKFYKYYNVKNNYIVESAKIDSSYDQNSRVYGVNGVSPTIAARDWKDAKKIIVEVAKITECKHRSVATVSYENGVCPTINSMNGGNREPKVLIKGDCDGVFSKYGYIVRKLTPIECWRLMGFSDEDYFKAKDIGGLSNSKLYERAGRGIVVPMLEDQFKILFKQYI